MSRVHYERKHFFLWNKNVYLVFQTFSYKFEILSHVIHNKISNLFTSNFFNSIQLTSSETIWISKYIFMNKLFNFPIIYHSDIFYHKDSLFSFSELLHYVTKSLLTLISNDNFQNHALWITSNTYELFWVEMKSSLYEAITKEISPRKPLQPQSINSNISWMWEEGLKIMIQESVVQKKKKILYKSLQFNKNKKIKVKIMFTYNWFTFI